MFLRPRFARVAMACASSTPPLLHPSPAPPSPLLHSFSHSLALRPFFSASHMIRVSHPHCGPQCCILFSGRFFGPHGEDGAKVVNSVGRPGGHLCGTSGRVLWQCSPRSRQVSAANRGRQVIMYGLSVPGERSGNRFFAQVVCFCCR